MADKIRVLLPEEDVNKRISEVAEQISKDYEGKQIHLICILKGGVFFTCELAKRITEALAIPVIGIGAGNVTDGQILVMHDAFGITGGHIPKFAKNFLAETGDIRAAVRQYMAEVESGVYPGEEHSFH